MKLTYNNKSDFIFDSVYCDVAEKNGSLDNNKLIKGDNLEGLDYLLKQGFREKIKLVYIDPPFATGGVFRMSDNRANTISQERNGIVAYGDKMLGSDYLEFLRQRLFYLKELMSKDASIYLHIDYKIGHYVKVIMDEVFGIHNFRNDITRIKCNPKNFKRNAYGNIKDMILFYTKTDEYVWNEPTEEISELDIEKLFKKTDKKGKKYTTIPLHAPGETQNGVTGKEWKGLLPPKGRHWRCSPEELDLLEKSGLVEWSSNGNPRKIIYAEDAIKKGKRMQDVWTFKDPSNPVYPTEKNIEMIKKIIETSSNEGDIVLDCFCGSGTTLLAAQELHRKWVGIDSSESAIKVVTKKIDSRRDMFNQSCDYCDLALSTTNNARQCQIG